MAGTWAVSGNQTRARQRARGCGTPAAALSYGGQYPGTVNSTECDLFNGSTWSSTTALNTGQAAHQGFGTTSAAVQVGGEGGNTLTQLWNGSAWSNGNNCTAQYYGAAAGIQSAGIQFGMINNGLMQTFNGSTWSTGTSMTTITYGCMGCGTQSSAFAGGGNSSSNTATELWNGAARTAGGTLATGRMYSGMGGSSTAAVTNGNNGYSTTTEQYNGSAWSAGGALGTGKGYHGTCGSTSSSILSFGGQVSGGAATNITEIYTIPPATNIKNINGCTYANTKSINGLAIASVKNWNGLV